ncbi:TlpA disulfide reductase family protein [Corynebacterium comes]|uniref:Sporulation thiol-disulfide oxidoreductase A n=1 Tax=Corynebacterium comes TaxID=2675218 RepID=A0A6B8VWJ1_9CORY|nr:TlpA disulfide reductase family protein [Corynebacterium comes]QGU04067.1 Sporulation thiol-disulfide oxidoreductase A precursor [Corynebacterium comes]
MPAPTSAEMFEFDVTEWFNSDALTMADLHGRVVLVEFFQMLCPGCVNHGIPQAQRVHRMVSADQVAVIGIHSVFEHHDVMGPAALEVFLAEFGVTFPVAVDRPGEVLPVTMKRWRLEGTPTTLLVDRQGKVRQVWLGQLDDLALGVWLGTLLAED